MKNELSPEFEKELLVAIQKALGIVGIRPEWILSFIKPVILKYMQEK